MKKPTPISQYAHRRAKTAPRDAAGKNGGDTAAELGRILKFRAKKKPEHLRRLQSHADFLTRLEDTLPKLATKSDIDKLRADIAKMHADIKHDLLLTRYTMHKQNGMLMFSSLSMLCTAASMVALYFRL